jgi:hypothetical protein
MVRGKVASALSIHTQQPSHVIEDEAATAALVAFEEEGLEPPDDYGEPVFDALESDVNAGIKISYAVVKGWLSAQDLRHQGASESQIPEELLKEEAGAV